MNDLIVQLKKYRDSASATNRGCIVAVFVSSFNAFWKYLQDDITAASITGVSIAVLLTILLWNKALVKKSELEKIVTDLETQSSTKSTGTVK